MNKVLSLRVVPLLMFSLFTKISFFSSFLAMMMFSVISTLCMVFALLTFLFSVIIGVVFLVMMTFLTLVKLVYSFVALSTRIVNVHFTLRDSSNGRLFFIVQSMSKFVINYQIKFGV